MENSKEVTKNKRKKSSCEKKYKFEEEEQTYRKITMSLFGAFLDSIIIKCL